MKSTVQALALASMAGVPIAVATGAAEQRPPELLARNGKWVLNVDRDSCQLIAQFGEGDAMVMAKFTQFEPDAHFDLALIGKRMRHDAANGEAKLDFGLSAAPIRADVMNGNLGKWPAAFISSVRLDGWRAEKFGDVGPEITPAQVSAVSGMTLRMGGKRAFRLDFGSLGKPFAQLRGCATNLLHGWGYDQRVQATLLRPVAPITPPATWLESGDYPHMPLMMGQGGFVQFRFDVDVEGKVAGCYILERTSPDQFADTVCRVLTKRARFQPALDERGKAVRSYFVSKVKFVMPG